MRSRIRNSGNVCILQGPFYLAGGAQFDAQSLQVASLRQNPGASEANHLQPVDMSILLEVHCGDLGRGTLGSEQEGFWPDVTILNAQER